MNSLLSRIFCFLLFSLLVSPALGQPATEPVSKQEGEAAESVELLVAVAASAAPAFEEIAAAFSKETGIKVQLSPGASGLLLKQVEEGAPFDLFVSADMARPQELADKGFADTESVRAFARGELMLWQPAGDSASTTPWSEAIMATTGRLAIAQPDQAPYGKAALQALDQVKIKQELEGRIVYGSNVQQVFQFADTGNVDFAFIPRSLAKDLEGKVWSIDQSFYEPIDQGMVVLKKSPRAAQSKQFFDFVLGDAGWAILESHGFARPPAPATETNG